MKILTVVGARPNFMKAAPIIAAIRAHNCRDPRHQIDHVLVHTGQHYDQAMSNSFFTDLGLPEPDYNLGVGSGSHAAQTAEIMKKFEEVLLRERPDVLIVVGDVNSTLACSLVAAKISFDGSGRRPLIAHVEAGLRSFDRTMPEEVNRVLTDQLSDFLFTTEESARHNLMQEGVPADRVHFVGNTMIDSLVAYQAKADASTILADLGLRNGALAGGPAHSIAPYALLTLHRPANVDTREAFINILEGLSELAADHTVVFPTHPRTLKHITEFGLERYFHANHTPHGSDRPVGERECAGIRIVEPLGYTDFLCLIKNARVVITDSGGIQEETTVLRIPCVTVRDNTERPITLSRGTNTLAGVKAEGICKAVTSQLRRTFANDLPPKWDGKAAERIVSALIEEFQSRREAA